MDLPPEIFKAYDIRGIVGCSLTESIVEELGWAIGDTSIERGIRTIIIGWDGRPSGPIFANALASGIQSSGCDVILIGMTPTPVTYFATHFLNIHSAVAITGSHNPSQYNGLKIIIAKETLAGEAIQSLRARCSLRKNRSKGNILNRSVNTAYCSAIQSDIRLDKPLRIAIDFGNGVAGNIGPDLYRSLGCQVVAIHAEVDGNFPNHHPDPSQPENLCDLQDIVTDQKLDFGLAFDGDGDRLGVVSPDGEIIWPDRQLILFAQDILERKPGSEIIFDVKCSRNLSKAIDNAGGIPTMWRTGHSFIKAKLKQSGAALAGEMSGHIFFQDRWYGFDDAIYAGARLCEFISTHQESVNHIFNTIPNTINTPELRLEMDEGSHHQLIGKLKESAKFDYGTISHLDGIRVDYPDGFGLARASNTTPTIIFRFEADSNKALQRIQNDFRKNITMLISGSNLPF
ncbi:MAG: phosphomannomutase/phosphoglucomutase [Acidiferrobacteraceae bacterium]|nr:phosphomannomutase/phosphoglucomutase [Acidiferrobacteraceae bacterium]|tara:strand:- start:20325 stop:21695 length:1371 start_codon:yes stop_codon:yes gene_type:complete